MPDDLIRQVALRIGEVRERAKLTQEEVAESLGMAVKNYQRIENGKQNLTILTVGRIAKVLGVAPLDLWRAPRRRFVRPGRPRKK